MRKVEINCKKCKRKLGDIREDGQYFEVENINLFLQAKIFCKFCGRHFNFVPSELPQSPLDEQIETQNKYKRKSNLGKIK